jgi:hypothetical protein
MVAGTPPLVRTTLSRRDARATFSGYGKPRQSLSHTIILRVYKILTMSVYRRLKRNNGLLRIQGLPHLLRDAEEAIVGQVAPSSCRSYS